MFCERLVTACRSFRRCFFHVAAFVFATYLTFYQTIRDTTRLFRLICDYCLRRQRNHVLRLIGTHQLRHPVRVTAVYMAVSVENEFPAVFVSLPFRNDFHVTPRFSIARVMNIRRKLTVD